MFNKSQYMGQLNRSGNSVQKVVPLVNTISLSTNETYKKDRK